MRLFHKKLVELAMVSEGEDIEVFREAVVSILEVIKSKLKPTKTYSSSIKTDLTNRT